MMFKRGERSVILSFIDSILLTAFLCLFVLIGTGLLLSGYNQMSTENIFKNMANMPIDQLEPGKVVRFKMPPIDYNVIQSPQSSNHCILYNLDHFNHWKDNDGDHHQSLEKTILVPEQLTLTDGNEKFVIDLKTPQAHLAMKNKLTYLKGKYDQGYRLTTKTNFDDNDNTIEESLLYPQDEVTVFGVLKAIDQTSKENTRKLVFEKNDIDFFKDPLSSAFSLVKSAINQEVQVYIVSNDSDENIQKAITGSGGLFLVLFGLLFGGIPLLIIIGTWLALLKDLIFKF